MTEANCYKVLCKSIAEEKLISCVQTAYDLRIHYVPGQIVRAPVGRIFVFRSYKYALRFAEGNISWVIWSARGVGLRSEPVMLPYEWVSPSSRANFWKWRKHVGVPFLKRARRDWDGYTRWLGFGLSRPPKGTYTVSSLMLLEEVYHDPRLECE